MNRGGFSWSRFLGISATKSNISRKIGIPLTKSGRNQKIGRIVSKGCMPMILIIAILPILLALVFF